MEEIAQVYSRSLFEVAKEHGKLDRIRDELGAFTDALAENRELSVFFFSPYFSTQEKEDGLRRTVVDADPTLTNFLQVLIENHRLPVIHRIRRQFDVLWDHENKRLPVEVAVLLGDLEQGARIDLCDLLHLYLAAPSCCPSAAKSSSPSASCTSRC